MLNVKIYMIRFCFVLLGFIILIFPFGNAFGNAFEECECNSDAGYVEIKREKPAYYTNNFKITCYNSKTLLSYEIISSCSSKNGKNYTSRSFYYDGLYCGYNCDFEGKNCEIGICNVSECSPDYVQFKKYNFLPSNFPVIKEKSDYYPFAPFAEYSELFEREKVMPACYNPQIDLAYTVKSKDMVVFATNNEICGYNCDANGKNCKIGVCNV
jgi:hypothetical protein